MRRELTEQGLDAGPHTIACHLEQHHRQRLSAATVWRICSRAGQITPPAPITPPARRVLAGPPRAGDAWRCPVPGRSEWVAGRQAGWKVAQVVIREHEHPVRQATPPDAVVVAELLDAFNREFDTPSPGTEVLAARLRQLIAGDGLVALLSGEPAVCVAVLSFRPSVWYDGPVAVLDELYVQPDMRGQRFGHAMLEAASRLARTRGAQTLEINVDGEDTDARRFYEAHGFANTEPGATEPMFYYYRDLNREQHGAVRVNGRESHPGSD